MSNYVPSFIAGIPTAASINGNLVDIEAAIKAKLDRYNVSGGVMQDSLDMNSNRIVNLSVATNAFDAIPLKQANDIVEAGMSGQLGFQLVSHTKNGLMSSADKVRFDRYALGDNSTYFNGDLDNLTTAGMYYIDSASTNMPTAGGGYVVAWADPNSTDTGQLFLTAAAAIYSRVKASGVWSAWKATGSGGGGGGGPTVWTDTNHAVPDSYYLNASANLLDIADKPAALANLGVPDWDKDPTGNSLAQRNSNGTIEAATPIVPNPSDDSLTSIKWFYVNPMGFIRANGAPSEVTVGSGGDYSNIGDALTFLSKFRREYSGSSSLLQIRLLSGFVMSEQVYLNGQDLSYIRIVSDDATVTVDHTALTVKRADVYSAFMAGNSSLPYIACKFSMDGSGKIANLVGILVGANSSAAISSGGGFINSRDSGMIVAQSSSVTCNGSDFSGSAGNGVLVGSASSAHFYQGSSVANSGGIGLASVGCSKVNANALDASNCGTYGIYSEGVSLMAAQNADASGAGTFGAAVFKGGQIYFGGPNAVGTTNITPNNYTVNGLILT